MEDVATASTAAGKGTVTSLASMFPVNEAQKAAKRVEEKIEEKRKELDCIKEFITENTNLINLVSKLPDELHYDIMVPFGRAAFFPGRLIHTNELMVLLGEGYYAERTAKQTAEILKRRGKALDSQVESLKTHMKDLKAEASFFDVTASEAAGGLVEIREDYVDENSSERCSKSDDKKDDKKVAVGDDEYARIMSRLDELEKEELEAEVAAEFEQKVAVRDDEYAHIMSRFDELEKEELEADGELAAEDDEESDLEQHDAAESDNESDTADQTSTAENDSESLENIQTNFRFHQHPDQIHSEMKKSWQQTTAEMLSNKYHLQHDITEHSEALKRTQKSGFDSSKAITSSIVQSDDTVPTNSRQRGGTSSLASKQVFDGPKAFTSSIMEKADPPPTNSQQQAAASSQASKSAFDSSKAFTGSIVERTYNLPTSPGQTSNASQPSNSQPLRPVSRFKMQRR